MNKPSDVTIDNCFTNNGLAFLFSEMRYDINDIKIQKLKYPRITTCLKGYCSYSPNDMQELQNAAWDIEIKKENNKDFSPEGKFSGCIPLNHLFGFCEDYKKIMFNCNQQLILNQLSNDLDTLYVKGISGNTVGDNYKKVTIKRFGLVRSPCIKIGEGWVRSESIFF
jgi:hypothetical protein